MTADRPATEPRRWDGLFRCEDHPAGTHDTIEEAEACIQSEPILLHVPCEHCSARAEAAQRAAPRAEGLEGALRVLVATASKFISRSGSLPSNAAQHVIELDIAIDHAIQALDAGGHEPVNDQHERVPESEER